jgi:hypothetical protein
MIQRFAADAIVGLHFAFILWAVFGALTLLKHRAFVWAHLPVLAWAGYAEFSGRICPLTPLENQFRRLAGEAGYGGGFIEHYLTGVIYPLGLTRNVQFVLGTALIAFNVLVYIIAFARRVPRVADRGIPPSP